MGRKCRATGGCGETVCPKGAPLVRRSPERGAVGLPPDLYRARLIPAEQDHMPACGGGSGGIDHPVIPGRPHGVGGPPCCGGKARRTFRQPWHRRLGPGQAKGGACGRITQIGKARAPDPQGHDHARRIVGAEIGGNGMACRLGGGRQIKGGLPVMVKPPFGRGGPVKDQVDTRGGNNAEKAAGQGLSGPRHLILRPRGSVRRRVRPYSPCPRWSPPADRYGRSGRPRQRRRGSRCGCCPVPPSHNRRGAAPADP